MKQAFFKKTFVGIVVILLMWPAVAQAEIYYYHQDHLGGSSVVTDEDGNVAAVYDYYPFGETYQEIIYDPDFSNNYKYTDQEEDPETGLYYYGARYYDTGVGRFMSQDPAVYDERLFENLKDPQSLNAYSYVRNNPVKYTDPSGEEWQDMNAKEKKLTIKHPIAAIKVFISKNYAENATYNKFGKSFETFHNNEADAYRHAAWAAKLTQLVGEKMAYEFLSAHESNPDLPDAEVEMDMFNNITGIELALDERFANSSAEEIANYALENDLLQTSPEDGNMCIDHNGEEYEEYY